MTLEAARGWGESGCLPSEVREISAEAMSEPRPHGKNQLCGGQRKSTLNGGTHRCKGGAGGRACSGGSRPDVTRSDGKGAPRPVSKPSHRPTHQHISAPTVAKSGTDTEKTPTNVHKMNKRLHQDPRRSDKIKSVLGPLVSAAEKREIDFRKPAIKNHHTKDNSDLQVASTPSTKSGVRNPRFLPIEGVPC